MDTRYKSLLDSQIQKLDFENFDLEAWKSSTISVLSRIFGRSDFRAEQINQLKIDYSSWALRDSSANYNPIEAAKQKGREILLTAIEEMTLFGIEDRSERPTLHEVSGMNEKDRKNYFNKQKKEKLIEFLMRLTS